MLTRGNWRQPLLFIIICTLFTGLIYSRALLSIASAAFILLLISQGSFATRIWLFFRTPILIIISALFFIPFISVLWSYNKDTWLQMMITKLPLILFPLAFAQGFHLSTKQWKHLAIFFLLLVLVATVYSTAVYLNNKVFFEAAYKQAKVFPTPMHGDHLRFSLLVSMAFLLSIFLFQKSNSIMQRTVSSIIALWFIIYLHLLAARTGLLCTYIILFCILIHYTIRKKNALLTSFLFISLMLLPMLAWISLPTFKARFSYLRYDLTQVFYGHYTPGTTDGSRALSLKGGWQILKGAPMGVGLGDIKYEMEGWYHAAVPGIQQSDKLFPSSEWLIHGLIAGWAGIILFTGIIAIPFFMLVRHLLWWRLLHAVLACSILFDTGLSTQFGIFIYAFFILLWREYGISNREQNGGDIT